MTTEGSVIDCNLVIEILEFGKSAYPWILCLKIFQLL